MQALADVDCQAIAPDQHQIDFFARNGYLPWRRFLADAEIVELRAEYDRVLEQARSADGWRNLSAGSGADAQAQRAHPQQMLQVMQVCERSLIFRRLLYDRRVLSVVRAFLGPQVMLFHDQALFKPAHTGGAVLWHQDNGYWKVRPANLISCWITLDDAEEDNGAMQVIPGSHLTPVSHEASETVLLDVRVDASRAVVVPLEAGACLFHHCQTLHYTAPNTTDRQRRAFIIHVMVPGTTSEHSAAMPVGFSRPVLSSTW